MFVSAIVCYVFLLQQKLRAAFNQEAIDTGREPLLLTAALDVGKSTIDAGYEVALLAP